MSLQELAQRACVLAVAEHAERVLQDESLGPQPEVQADGSSADGVRGLEVSRGGGLGPRVLGARDRYPDEIEIDF